MSHSNRIAAIAAAVVSGAVTQAALASPPFTTPEGSAPYSPQDMESAYGFNQLYTRAVKPLDGTGQTIAIVDASFDSTIASDVNAFISTYNALNPTRFQLPAINLTTTNQTGGSASTAGTANLSAVTETSLDVEYAHAIAPNAKILLVEANSLSTSDLFTAVRFAASQTNVSTVSVSFGVPESAFTAQNPETQFDGTFTQPANHTGVTYVASSGDSGVINYPALSPHVLAVGGTTLSLTSTGAYAGETAWSGSGGGTSKVETEPGFQQVAQQTGFRTNPDVSYDADPNTGVGIALTDPTANSTADPNGGKQFFEDIGGTSAGAPQWAALIALANEGRSVNGLAALTSDDALTMLYATYNTALYPLLFHDVTSGSNTNGQTAGVGYDEVTGLGSPNAVNVVNYLDGDLTLASVPEPTVILVAALALVPLVRRRRACRFA